jgi:hypothetical protein
MNFSAGRRSITAPAGLRIHLAPQSLVVHTNLARALCDAGRIDEAIKLSLCGAACARQRAGPQQPALRDAFQRSIQLRRAADPLTATAAAPHRTSRYPTRASWKKVIAESGSSGAVARKSHLAPEYFKSSTQSST